MSRYRSKLRIVADILFLLSQGDVCKTRIMFDANLSWLLLNKYLGVLTDAGLVRSNDLKRYMITAKGRLFIERFTEYSKRRSKVEERIEDVNSEKRMLEKMCINPFIEARRPAGPERKKQT